MAIINTLPPVLDIVCYAGDDTRIRINMTSNEVPVDLTGTHEACVRLTRSGEELGCLVVDLTPGIGMVDLTVSSELSAELVADITVEQSKYFGNDLITAPMFEGVWDWNYTVGSDTKTLAQGKFTVIKDVSR